MVSSYNNFPHFQEPASVNYQRFFFNENPYLKANLPNALSNTFPESKIADHIAMQPQCTPTHIYQNHQIYHNPLHVQHEYASPNFHHPSPKVKAQPKTTLWEEFKRIYITEVIAFTMNKSTLFTLIFSFMFLGCIFFLSGFFTATNIYREQHVVSDTNNKHMPSETALLQGRPERAVNMGSGIVYATPKAYQYQGGVKIDHNRRRPSTYAEGQIANGHSNYR